MRATPSDVYSAREIALAAGVSEGDVRAALTAIGSGDGYAGRADAVRIGRALAARTPSRAGIGPSSGLFTIFSATAAASRRNGVPGVPLAVSSTLHGCLLAAVIFFTTFGLTPHAAAFRIDEHPEPMRLVFLATPGPGGGGGGGGLQQRLPPPKALREGRRAISSPLPRRDPPKPIVPLPAPPEPKPAPLEAEPLPAVIAPVVVAPADARSRIGVLDKTPASTDSHGAGRGGGVGTGGGTGIGDGRGPGIGPGSGGGTGGGPYRPGSGIEPPRVQREVKADYTEDARRRNVEGEVVLEIVVRSDGTVGDVRLLQGLGAGLDDRAVQAVRQWRFSPARRLGAPVDVIVEVAVEFKLR
jgi:periplasmic protein TonB